MCSLYLSMGLGILAPWFDAPVNWLLWSATGLVFVLFIALTVRITRDFQGVAAAMQKYLRQRYGEEFALPPVAGYNLWDRQQTYF